MERQENLTETLPEEIGEPLAAEEAAPPDGGLQEELRLLQDKYLRLAAEYDNFRKRTAKERETLVTDSRCYALAKLFPVLDNLERAAAQPCADEAYAQGIAMIARQWSEALEQMGVTAIDALNRPFDPNLHNAVMHGEDDSLPANTVAEIFQKGYMSGDKVIRPSMVKVVN
ncbi:MAG: nucleotide exchange factor GrpE [Oscillospiraceae bacterium]|nr:nucleotide exchange factor GrpE [Oscillospiraceae bacterium]